jgi:hypothetical protein
MFLTPYQLALVAGGFTILGALLNNWIGHLLVVGRDKKNRLIAARLAFRDSFTPAIRIIEKRNYP